MATTAAEKLQAPAQDPTTPYKVRFRTATSLFDGHDAAINSIRRSLQALGTEVIHLGHNCSAQEMSFNDIRTTLQALIAA